MLGDGGYSAEHSDEQANRRLAELFGDHAVGLMAERDIPLRAAANAICHLQAQLDRDGITYAMGWGDAHRRLPIIVVQGAEGVRDVTVPDMSDRNHRALVALFVADEDAWAVEREVAPRDITGELDRRSMADIIQQGIPAYAPHTPYAHWDESEVFSFWRVDRPGWPTPRS